MKPAKIIKPALILFFLAINFSLFTKFISAQSASGLSAIPPRLELTVKPDGVATEIIKVRNESKSEKQINTFSSDFVVTDDKGTPIQIKANSTEDNRWAASNWISVSPSSVKLKPGETKSLVLTVMPPIDALPGGHYAMVIHTPEGVSAVSGTGASVQTQVGTLVYITIPGDIKQAALIEKFTAPKFSEFGPVDFNSTIKNLSDIHITPNGGITIKNIFGGQTAFLNLDKTNIFPYTSREFTNTLNKKFLFGRYTANLDAQYGTDENIASAALVFWVIPWRLLILVLAAIAIIIAIILINKNKPQQQPLTLDEKNKELEKELEALKNKYKDR
jgi:hypothetical protein